jgi:hypothetical protein
MWFRIGVCILFAIIVIRSIYKYNKEEREKQDG